MAPRLLAGRTRCLPGAGLRCSPLLLLFLSAALAAGAQSASAAAAGEETAERDIPIPVPNGSFELGDGDSPASWSTRGQGRPGWGIEGSEGGRCAVLSGTVWEASWFGPTMDLLPDEGDFVWYGLTATVRNDAPTSETRLILAWFGDTGWISNSEGVSVRTFPADGWQESTLWAMPPAGAKQLQIHLRSDLNPQSVSFDEVSLRATVLPQAEGPDRQAEEYAAFLSQYPHDALAFHAFRHLVSQLTAAGHLERAREDLVHARDYDVAPAVAADLGAALALAFAARNQNAQAMDVLDNLAGEADVSPGFTDWARGRVYAKAGDHRQALSAFQNALDHAGGAWFEALLLNDTGLSYEGLGDWDTAVGVYERLSTYAWMRPRGLMAWSHGLLTLRRIPECVEVLDRLAEEFPDSPEGADAAFSRGILLETLGRFEEALAQHQSIIAQGRPQFRQGALHRAAVCLLQLHRPRDAVGMWHSAVAGAGDDIAARSLYSNLIRTYEALAASASDSQGAASAPLQHPEWPGGQEPLLVSGANAFYAEREFLFVYGTRGTAEETRVLRAIALGMQQFWRDHHSREVAVRADTELTPQELAQYDLVLYGSPQTNQLLAQWNDQLPIRFEGATLRLADRQLDAQGLGLIMLSPTPGIPGRYLVAYEALDLNLVAGANQVHHGLTDYVVFDARSFGEPGKPIVELGFLDKSDPRHWRPYY